MLWRLFTEKKKSANAGYVHVSQLSCFVTDHTSSEILRSIWRRSTHGDMYVYWAAVRLRRCPQWLADLLQKFMVSMALDPETFGVGIDEPSRLDYVAQYREFLDEAEIY